MYPRSSVKLGTATGGEEEVSVSAFDLANINFTEPVRAVKVVGLDNNGTSPGFDLGSVEGTENFKLANGEHTVTVAEEETAEGLNFGNGEILVPPDEDVLSLEDLGITLLDTPIEVEPGITLIGYGPEDLGVDELENINAANTTNVDQLQSGGGLGLGLDGSGITVGVWDGGSVRNRHEEFVNDAGISRVNLRDPLSLFNSHATHVAGTIGAEGDLADSVTQGMANGVNILSFDLIDDFNELKTEAESGSIHLSNHSYGKRGRKGWTIRFVDGIRRSVWDEDRALFTEDRDFGKYDTDTRELVSYFLITLIS